MRSGSVAPPSTRSAAAAVAPAVAQVAAIDLGRRACLFALAASCVSGPASANGRDPSTFATNFDGMSLVDQEGRPFAFRVVAGQVLLVNFVFTGCSTVCPVQTRVLAEVLRGQAASGAGAKLRFVSFSLDPVNDTPAVLKAYAQSMGVDLARWSFVTGRPEDIDRISERLRLFRPGELTKRPDDHATTLWLVDARGRLMLRLNGNPPDAARLTRELTALRSL